MADKNIQMKQKTASGYDNIYPQTKSANITDATADATPNTVVKRDPSGRAKFPNPSAATDAANKQFVEGYALPKSGGDVTGVIGIDEAEGGAIFPLIDPKNATAPPSDYPDGISMMRLSSSQSGWPNLGTDASKTVISFIAAKGSGNRILQIVSQKVNGRVAIRVGNSDGSGWSDFFELYSTARQGAGSGLDADMLDGLQATAFAQLGQANTFTQTQTAPRIRLTATTDASPTSTNHAFQIGADGAANLIMDTNEILARDGVGGMAALHLNGDGGLVTVNNAAGGGEVWHRGHLRWNSGRLEYNDGGSWVYVDSGAKIIPLFDAGGMHVRATSTSNTNNNGTLENGTTVTFDKKLFKFDPELFSGRRVFFEAVLWVSGTTGFVGLKRSSDGSMGHFVMTTSTTPVRVRTGAITVGPGQFLNFDEEYGISLSLSSGSTQTVYCTSARLVII